MPAPATVSVEDIINAGREIIAGGRKVTGWTLRREVGRGQPERLFALWEQAQQQAENSEPASESAAPVHLPPALVDQADVLRTRLTGELDAVIVALWTTAERIAAERLGAEVLAAEQARATAEAELAEAAQAVEAADAARDMVVAELTAAREATAEAERRAIVDERRYRNEAEASLRHASEQAARFEAVAEERKRQLEQTRASFKLELEEFNRLLRAAHGVGDALTAELTAARDVAAEAERRASAAEAQRKVLEDDLRRVIAEEKQRRHKVEADLHDTRERAARYEALAEERGRVIDRLTKVPAPHQTTVQDVGEWPIVPDRLALPKDQRDAYDDGVLCGRTGRSVPSRRYQPEQRRAHLRPFWEAGYRDSKTIQATPLAPEPPAA